LWLTAGVIFPVVFATAFLSEKGTAQHHLGTEDAVLGLMCQAQPVKVSSKYQW
jgi:hypothetical protein